MRHGAAQAATRTSPCSTFKIPNSLIGLETGVIPDASFVLPWDGVRRSREGWNRDHDLRSAMKQSVVWYYQELARRVGPDRMQKWVSALRYGNEDISGGIDRFWLESSLRISPDEQVDFLGRLHAGELPVSPRSIAIVKEILLQDAPGPGIVYRGKTGSCQDPGAPQPHGWWVGSVEKEGSLVLYVGSDRGARGLGPGVPADGREGARGAGRAARALKPGGTRMQRPTETEYASFYRGYVALVPETDIVGVLEPQVEEIRRLLAAVPAERETYRYAEGKWSIRQVLGHLVDGERVFGYRAFCFSRGEQAALPSFDENQYVAGARARTGSRCASWWRSSPSSAGQTWPSSAASTLATGRGSGPRAASPCRCAPWPGSWPATRAIT